MLERRSRVSLTPEEARQAIEAVIRCLCAFPELREAWEAMGRNTQEEIARHWADQSLVAARHYPSHACGMAHVWAEQIMRNIVTRIDLGPALTSLSAEVRRDIRTMFQGVLLSHLPMTRSKS